MMTGNPGKPKNVSIKDDGHATFIAQQPLVTFEDYAILCVTHAYVSAQPGAPKGEMIDRIFEIAGGVVARRETIRNEA